MQAVTGKALEVETKARLRSGIGTPTTQIHPELDERRICNLD